MLAGSRWIIALVPLFVDVACAGEELSELDPVAVDTRYRSTSGTTRAAITFINRLESPVDIYWIDYNGHRVFYQTLAPGERYLQLTFMTHPWLVVLGRTRGGIAEGSGALHTAFLPATATEWDADFDTAEIVQRLPDSDNSASSSPAIGGTTAQNPVPFSVEGAVEWTLSMCRERCYGSN